MAGIKTFLAEVSLEPGSKWTPVIFDNLKSADWIFFLASKSSTQSAAVQQELGASLIQGKTIIPVLIDITPAELPGWIGNHQAVDLKSSPETLRVKISQIAEKIKVDQFWAGLIFGAIIVGLIVLLSKSH